MCAKPSDHILLNVEHLSFAYPPLAGEKRKPVFEDINLQVTEGSFVLLVGSTGSGKTTLLRLCKKELAPAGSLDGSVEVAGRDVRDLEPQESAALVGYVFQNPDAQIVCDTVWHEMAFGMENLGVPEAEMRRRVAETCYFFGMEPWFRAKTSELSGGQRQLLALASVLTMRPKLLLLDEPTSMLDPVSEGNFLSMLYRANHELGVTVVVATHRPAPMAEYATSTFSLDKGQIKPVEVATLAHEQPLLSARFKAQEPCAAASPRTGGNEVVVHCSKVWFRYGREDAWVLRDAGLSVSLGEVRAIVGGNGSGKSTLLSLVAGILKPQHGRMKNELGRSQVLLPQNPKALLSQQSLREELLEWAPAGNYELSDALELLGQLGLGGGCETDGKSAPGLLKRHPYDLSGGEQQLLALTKLLLVHPRILLLDEPTKGLDHTARSRMAEVLLKARAEGATIIMATHDLAFAREVADSVSLLFDGEITLTQPCEEFFRDSWVWRS